MRRTARRRTCSVCALLCLSGSQRTQWRCRVRSSFGPTSSRATRWTSPSGITRRVAVASATASCSTTRTTTPRCMMAPCASRPSAKSTSTSTTRRRSSPRSTSCRGGQGTAWRCVRRRQWRRGLGRRSGCCRSTTPTGFGPQAARSTSWRPWVAPRTRSSARCTRALTITCTTRRPTAAGSCRWPSGTPMPCSGRRRACSGSWMASSSVASHRRTAAARSGPSARTST
mmetsp:Transcript_175842/g.563768  ORF Transcript_175842/g.563768 Transcript_175842/m.563768 type:complete len:228 (-) Transcript_175842:463-1146(-)